MSKDLKEIAKIAKGDTFEIQSYSIYNGKFGGVYIIQTDKGLFRTQATVLTKQLQQMKFPQKVAVNTRLSKNTGKDYMIFE
jgi:hypothetical protein